MPGMWQESGVRRRSGVYFNQAVVGGGGEKWSKDQDLKYISQCQEAMPARSIMLMHMLNPRDTKLSLKMTKKTPENPTLPCSEIRGAFLKTRQAMQGVMQEAY